MEGLEARSLDPVVRTYHTSELKVAAEFLTNWLPFLTRDLCPNCSQVINNRVRSLDQGACVDAEPSEITCSQHILDSPQELPQSPTSPDSCDTHSLGSWKDFANECSENAKNSTTTADPVVDSPAVRMSWADMAQEDELEEGAGPASQKKLWANMAQEDVLDERRGPSSQCSANEVEITGQTDTKKQEKPPLSRDQREYIRFMNVERKKDFICLERVKGKFANILDGLELHCGVFSAVERKRIVDLVYALQEMGRTGQLKERTYAEPPKWMRGKGRITLQFGCCYNYAVDKNGKPPGILDEVVDPIPPLFKVMIRRLVGWHVLPPSCVPDSCIVNIYEPGDCIPPHIDHHDFVRPFCTVSFLSECEILFGSDLRIVGPGQFTGSYAIPLPVGSVLVLKGNGADVAKHCVPAVATKRISITFRRMDDKKRPVGHVPEPDLLGLQPLSYDLEASKKWRSSPPQRNENKRLVVEPNWEEEKGAGSRMTPSEPNHHIRNRSRYSNRPRVRLALP